MPTFPCKQDSFVQPSVLCCMVHSRSGPWHRPIGDCVLHGLDTWIALMVVSLLVAVDHA